MKAWVLHQPGDIRWEEAERPLPAKGEVIVRVRAVGICGSDIPRIYRDGAHRMPLIPGHEFSGEVVEASDSMGYPWVGRRVGVFPLLPCRKCSPCRRYKYEMCRNYSYLGSRQDGGFAEYVKVPVVNLIELPDSVTYEQAAMLEPMAVAVHAIRRINPGRDDTVVVCGLGTIGMLLTMFLVAQGIEKVLVIGNKDYQKKKAQTLGIPDQNYCDIRESDVREWLELHTHGEGADVFFECVGKNETVSLAIASAAPSGRICLVGNPYTQMTLPKDVYWKVLRNQLMVTGTWNSSFVLADERIKENKEEKAESDWRYVLDWLEEGIIHPENFISHRFQLEDIEEGFRIMRDKSEDYLKIMALC